MKQKMKQLMMTLALLITAATSAWAESKPIGLNVEYKAGDVITTNSTGDVYIWYGIYQFYGQDPQEMAIKITSSVSPAISKLGIVESSGLITLDNNYAVYDMSGNTQITDDDIQCQGEVTGTTLEKVYVKSGSGTLTDPYVFAPGPAPAGNAFPITWIATSPNTASIEAMPAGNVTVNVKYYPQATADGAVTAATGVLATTDDPLVTVDKSMFTGVAKMMYYVSTETTAPAYGAEGWTDALPTAGKYTQAANLNVWYYPVGTDEGVGGATATYSDGDMNATALPVNLGDAPTYDVTLNAEGLSTDEADAWQVAKGTDDPAAFPLKGVMRGETVTVTYSGSKKIIGVKAEKKAPLIVNPEVGQYIGSDGKNYDANATLTDGVTFVAKICYVGSETGEDAPYNHGLALALSDANGGSTCKWKTEETDAGHTKQSSSTFTEESGLQYNDATHNSETYPAFKYAIANNGTAAPTGCSSWFLASGYQWKQMIGAAGLSNLGLQEGTCFYWSSSELNAGHAWGFLSDNGDCIWGYGVKDSGGPIVRACIAF